MRWRSVESVLISLKTTLHYLWGRQEGFKVLTEQYPDRVSSRMPEDLPQRFRGLIQNDIERCSGCRYCVEVCPVDCVHIETEPGPSKNVSWVAVFDVDHSRCMFCGLCVEMCPTKSLQHTREYAAAAFRVEDMVQSYGKGWATREMKERWIRDQKALEAKAEELALLEQSPVGGELRRRFRPEGRE